MTTRTFDLYSSDVCLECPPQGVFEELRCRQPAYWQEVPGGSGCWAVLRHADDVPKRLPVRLVR